VKLIWSVCILALGEGGVKKLVSIVASTEVITALFLFSLFLSWWRNVSITQA